MTFWRSAGDAGDAQLFYGRLVRWNSPYINHFTSPDTIIPNPYSSQSWDRYAYVNNNPVNATDPTGHQCVGEPEECLEDDGTTGPGFPGTGGTVNNPGAGDCSGSGCQGEDDNDPSSTDVCDQILGCEDSDAGVFCDQYSCWYDADTDISGTYEDPAVYFSLLSGGWASGLFETAGSGLYLACLRIYACANAVAHITGITVYRVWGGTAGPVGGSPLSRPASWTPINPVTVVNYASKAGLPPGNTAQYLSVGTIYSMENVSIVTAAEIGPNAGGLLEYAMANPQILVLVQEVQYLFP